MIKEQQIEDSLIAKLTDLKYTYRSDIKASLEKNFREKFQALNRAQAINYLEAYNLEVGLLLNFGARSLEYKRLINSKFKAKNHS